ncbi:MAG: glycine reductase [Deltaproteobacteria bacterium]|nr:glycine reductase [Deltaproteobacteria bacterium]
MNRAVIAGTAAVLAHTPSLVRHGSKPARELTTRPRLLPDILGSLRSFAQAVGYRPNQAFIGAIHPRQMGERPWITQPLNGACRFAPFGEAMPEHEFLGLLALSDEFSLVRLAPGAAEAAAMALARHPLARYFHLERLTAAVGNPEAEVTNGALPLHVDGDHLVASLRPGHPEDESLSAIVLLENLAGKATGALALAHLLVRHRVDAASIDYVIGCAEDAVGDRYQRGGGNMGKAIAAMLDCTEASGADVKNFCAAPIPAIVVAASLVSAGVFKKVAVVGGGSLPKLGMKFQGHLKHGMPILEDMLGGIAVLVTADDGYSPVIRLDAVGRHRVRSGSSAQAIMEALVCEPLDALGLQITDVDEYATEMHNPELTEPQGSGNVPDRNYRMIAALAVRRGLFGREGIESFLRGRGMPGFAPTQGHVASAFCYAGHAHQALTISSAQRVMLLAKGSLFLGLMSQQSDGMSVLLERHT